MVVQVSPLYFLVLASVDRGASYIFNAQRELPSSRSVPNFEIISYPSEIARRVRLGVVILKFATPARRQLFI